MPETTFALFGSSRTKPYRLLPCQNSYTQPPEKTAVRGGEYSLAASWKVRGPPELVLYSESKMGILELRYQTTFYCRKLAFTVPVTRTTMADHTRSSRRFKPLPGFLSDA
jgi:hypothetical protein